MCIKPNKERKTISDRKKFCGQRDVSAEKSDCKGKSGEEMTKIVYVALKERIQVNEEVVRVGDVADILTHEEKLTQQIEQVPLFQFQGDCHSQKDGDGQGKYNYKSASVKSYSGSRQIISMLRVVQMIRQEQPDCLVLPTGEQDCVVEYISAKQPGKFWGVVKVAFVCLVSLAGGAFSIMAFHNDISITNIFTQFYEVITGRQSDGFTLLELAYSIGLAAGIVIFYNHVGKRRITKDPTPIEVSMRTYEHDMDDAMIQAWDREGKKIDVQ